MVFVIVALPVLRHARGADRHRCALVGGAFNGDTVVRAKVDAQTVIDILDADAGAVTRLILQEGRDLLRLHADAVVRDDEQNIIPVGLYGDFNVAGIDHQIQPVIDGIFNDGLQGDLVAVVIQAPRVHVKFIGELVFVAVLLDLEIALGVLDLLGDGDELVAAADADAEQPRQCMDHLDSIGVFAALTHPGDGIQRIVEKMRVDLRLQRLELCLAQDNFLLADGGHKLLDAAYHVAEGVREVLHLPRAAHGLKGEVVGVLLRAAATGGTADGTAPSPPPARPEKQAPP